MTPSQPSKSPKNIPEPADEVTADTATGALSGTQNPTLGSLQSSTSITGDSSQEWQSLVGQSFGDFELVAELGRGGMGIVYQAHQKSLSRVVALKILQSDHFRNPTILSRFLAEAKAAASLTHPNIVTIFQTGQCPAGHYFVMEYVDGKTLESLIEERPLPFSWVVSLMIRLGEAVHFAHAKGIVHRDLKPANIMIEKLRRPVIMDFGIAKFLGRATALTEYGAILGTPSYMSPEQAREGATSVGPLSDIYSLGAIMYKALTGRVPYDGQDLLSVVLKVAGPDLPPPLRSLRPDVPDDLCNICMKCLSKDPAQRYPSGHALAQELRPLRAAFAPGKNPSPLLDSRAHPALLSPPKMVQFMITEGPDKGLVLMLPAEESLLVGRSRAAETKLNDPKLAGVHCNLKFDGKQVVVEDFHSNDGTFVNGQRVQRQELKPNDIIQIGGTKIRLLVSDSAGKAPSLRGSSGQGPASPASIPIPPCIPTPLSNPTPTAPAMPASFQSPVGPAPAGAESQDFNELLRDIERSSSPRDLSELEGTTLGPYEVGKVLGKGKSGLVFQGRETKKGLWVALKILHPDFLIEESQQRAYLQGMQGMHQLSHPNLVTLFRAGKTGDYCWLAMELVEGQSLRRILKKLGNCGRLDWRYAFQVAQNLGQALGFAHGHDIVHQLISPANVLIGDEDKQAKLSDLVQAQALTKALPGEMAKPWNLAGNLAFMAPEQTDETGEIDARSDLYGLGATLYAILLGQPPVRGSTPDELIDMIQNRKPLPPSRFQVSVPSQFEHVVMKLLAKNPDHRFESAEELLSELERVAQILGM